MRFMVRLLLIFCFCLLSCNAQKTEIQEINTLELVTVIRNKSVQLIDVRTTEEYQKGKIGNAKHIDYYQKEVFQKKIGLLDKTKPVYLYCHSGYRSKKAAEILIDLGFQEVYNYSGGWKEWKKH